MFRSALRPTAPRARLAPLALALAAASAVACSSAPASTGGGGPAPSKGTTGGTSSSSGAASSSGTATSNNPGPITVTETGTIVDYNSKAPVEGATITAGDQTVTSGADGSFTLTLKSGEAFALSVAAQGYATLLQQSTSLGADYAAGKITIVPSTLANILTGYFTGYDATLGVLSVDLVPTGACTSVQGATVAVTPAGSAKVAYFSGGLPAPDLTSAQAGQFPSAVIYNVEPGVPLSVEVQVPGCTQVPFPVTQDGVDYTGGITTQGGQVTGFARVFLQ